MVRNEVVPQLRFSPPRLLPSGVFQLAGNVRLVSDERHDHGHMFAMQGGPRSARVVPNTKIALDPLHLPTSRQPKFRVSGYSGGLTALKTDDAEVGGAGGEAIKSVVHLDYLQVHVSNKSPYAVRIECSVGGIVKHMSFNRGEARFNGMALDWRAEALTVLAAVVDEALANCGQNPSLAANADKPSESNDSNAQSHGKRDGVGAQVDLELTSLKKKIDDVSTNEALVRHRNSIVLETHPETLAIHGGRRHLDESFHRYYGKPPIGDDLVQLKMMEKEFTCLATVIEALEEASQRTNVLDRNPLLQCIESELPGDIRSDHQVVTLLSLIRDAPETREAASHAAVLKSLLQKVNNITTGNHGGIVTDLKTEWDFVVDPESVAEKLNLPELNSRDKCPVTGKAFPKRSPTPLDYYLSHELTTSANLTKPEVIGLRLYSGPSYQAINRSLREVIKDELQNRQQSMSSEEDPPGDAFASSTSMLRHFVATANAVNSALKKLGALTPPTPSRQLYRGLSQLSFRCSLLSNRYCDGHLAEHVGNASAKPIFVEPGVSSATPRLDVALSYCGATSSSLLEIETGGVDHGASLAWISQFPDEDEHAILPLSAFEVVGMRTVSRPYLNLEAALQADTRLFLNLHKLKRGVSLRKSLTADKLNSKQNQVKAARAGMAAPVEQLKLHVLFSQLDTDGDGSITLEEFKRFIKELHVDMSAQEAAEVFKYIDEDKNGIIEYDELERGMEEKSFNHQPRIKKLQNSVVGKRKKQMKLQQEMSKHLVLGDETFDDYVNVLTVKLNVNRVACTSEELLGSRRSMVFDLYKDLELEALHDRYCGKQVVLGLNDLWKQKYQSTDAHGFLHILRFQTAVCDLIGVWTNVLQREKSQALGSMQDTMKEAEVLSESPDNEIEHGDDNKTEKNKRWELMQRLGTHAAKVFALESFDDSQALTNSSLGEADEVAQSSQHDAMKTKPNDSDTALMSVLEVFNRIAQQKQRQHGADGLVHACRMIQEHGLRDNSMPNAKYVMKQVIIAQCERYACLPWLVSVKDLVSLIGKEGAHSLQLEERAKGRVDISSLLSYMLDPCPATATKNQEKTFQIISGLLEEYAEHFQQALKDKTTVSRFAQAVELIDSLKALMKELAGAVKVIIVAMEANEGLVQQGFSLLSTLVSVPKDDPSYIASERDPVLIQLEAQAEGMVRVLEKYPEHESVRKDGVQVLRQMWAEDEGSARSKLLMLKQQIRSKVAAQLLEEVFEIGKRGKKR